MINTNKINKVAFGGDYNPEQWDQEKPTYTLFHNSAMPQPGA